MKNYILIITSLILFIGCQKEELNVKFSGKIENFQTDSIIVFHPKIEYRKVIKLNTDGTFNDTLKVKNGLFSYSDGRDFTMLYLKNASSLHMSYNAKDFNNSLKYAGDFMKENTFLATSLKKENNLLMDTRLMKLPKDDFDKTISEYVTSFNNRLNEVNLDPPFKDFEISEINNFKDYITKSYIKTNYNKLYLGKGKPSPLFTNYVNFNGGTTSLTDLKGKYTFIDVWATWCKPCKNEIPYLQELEKKYHDKNINFVSISIDDKRDYDTWREMIKEKNMGGIQLYAKGDNHFTNDYRIISIPRFILLDPNGNIIEANAPKPSSQKVSQLFESLNL